MNCAEPWSPQSKRLAGWTIGLAVIAVALLGACQQHKSHADPLPSSLHAGRIVYEKSQLVGPRAADTSLVVFALPDESANAVEHAGIAYFREDGGDWQATPMAIVSDDPDQTVPTSIGIANFLARNDAGIPIDRKIEQMIDHAINTPGAFYRFGPGSRLIIVAPKERRAIVAYAG
jgi:hypothetical protein